MTSQGGPRLRGVACQDAVVRNLAALAWLVIVAAASLGACQLISRIAITQAAFGRTWVIFNAMFSLGQGLLALTAHYWVTASDNKWGGLKNRLAFQAVIAIVLAAAFVGFTFLILQPPVAFLIPFGIICLLLFQRWFVP